MVGLPDKVFKIVGFAPLDVAMVERELQVALAAVDAVHMEPGFGELQRIFAAQQAKAHHEITFRFIQHLLPPRPMA